MKVDSKIEELLEESFATESQANRKFLAFAGKADQEGCLQVAKFFRASAEGAAVQAYNLLLTLKEIKRTRENLENLIREETRETRGGLPGDASVAARDKGNRGAEAILIYAGRLRSSIFNSVEDFWKDWKSPEETSFIMYVLCADT